MDLVLKIAGGIVIGGLVLIVVGFLAVRLFLWNLQRNLGNALAGLKALREDAIISTDLDLQPTDDEALSAAALEEIEAFEALGFERAGVYQVGGQPIALALLADERRSLWASVSSSNIQDMVLDVVSRHADGTWVGHTTLRELGLQPPAGVVKTRMPEASASELVEQHLADRPAGAYQPATVANAEASVRQEFRDENLLRAWIGGLSDKELDANLKAMNEDADEGGAAMVLAMARGQSAGVLDEAFEQAAQQAGLVTETQVEDGRVLIVHPMSDPDDLVDDLADVEPEDLGGGATKLARFAERNTSLHPLGPIDLIAGPRTLRADAYLRPADHDS